ncbi:MAG TPA: L,D-transpeptidase family protein [Flavisolibacter sp.]|nr:L,D-transpeptidase family protein [Flavisolibacter sp.]
MKIKSNIRYSASFFMLLVLLILGCKSKNKQIGKQEIVVTPAELYPTISEILEASIEDYLLHNKHLESLRITNPDVVKHLYSKNSYKPIWFTGGIWNSKTDSLFLFIKDCRQYGLYPEHYFFNQLQSLKQQTIDTANKKQLNASLWAEQDLLLTTSLVELVYDLKLGRLVTDGIKQADTTLSHAFFEEQLARFKETGAEDWAAPLEPAQIRYHRIKEALKVFLDNADFRKFTPVDMKDTMHLKDNIAYRLWEQDSIKYADTINLEKRIKLYQKESGLPVTGKISDGLIKRLNTSDHDRFLKVAITLDRYKQTPALPENYIWVNIPSYQLQVWEADSVVLTSKIAVGKPITRTPIITSNITDMITYPLWTIPTSIIKAEILPNLKKDPAYLKRKGYSLADNQGNEIDPSTVSWVKYENGIPYRVIQGSGDANALGVLKFNFPNKFSVYLHDTNQRALFSKEKRALSHGCVRVQAWNELATYLLRRDSMYSVNATPLDSLQRWLAVKEKQVIPLRKRMPVFIRYYTCDATDGKLVFYEDIYGEDMKFQETYFSTK